MSVNIIIFNNFDCWIYSLFLHVIISTYGKYIFITTRVYNLNIINFDTKVMR